MKQKYTFLILFFSCIFSFVFGQLEEFQQSVDSCYSQEAFLDFKVRFEQEPTCYVGLDIPTFSATDIQGIKVDLESLRGKLVVMKFWSNYCPPCIEEIPYLNILADSLQNEDVVFLAPSVSEKLEIEELLSQVGPFNFRIIPDATWLFREHLRSKSGFPTTIIIDKNGVIQVYKMGSYSPHSDLVSEMLFEIRKLL